MTYTTFLDLYRILQAYEPSSILYTGFEVRKDTNPKFHLGNRNRVHWLTFSIGAEYHEYAVTPEDMSRWTEYSISCMGKTYNPGALAILSLDPDVARLRKLQLLAQVTSE